MKEKLNIEKNSETSNRHPNLSISEETGIQFSITFWGTGSTISIQITRPELADTSTEIVEGMRRNERAKHKYKE